jgi:hypothetical protein
MRCSNGRSRTTCPALFRLVLRQKRLGPSFTASEAAASFTAGAAASFTAGAAASFATGAAASFATGAAAGFAAGTAAAVDFGAAASFTTGAAASFTAGAAASFTAGSAAASFAAGAATTWPICRRKRGVWTTRSPCASDSASPSRPAVGHAGSAGSYDGATSTTACLSARAGIQAVIAG